VGPDILAETLKTLRFIKATSHLKTLKSSAKAISAIIDAVWPEFGASDTNIRHRMLPDKILARSRCQLDCAMLHFMRHYFDWARSHDPHCGIYMFVDGSPASGYEAFISVEHYFSALRWHNRLLSVGYLGYGYMGAKAKIYSLLWKIYMETGPSESMLRWRLAAVKGFTTDLGKERTIADCADCLQEFLEEIGSPLKVRKQKFLFPCAIYVTGWHHQWDHIAREVSGSDTTPSFC